MVYLMYLVCIFQVHPVIVLCTTLNHVLADVLRYDLVHQLRVELVTLVGHHLHMLINSPPDLIFWAWSVNLRRLK